MDDVLIQLHALNAAVKALDRWESYGVPLPVPGESPEQHDQALREVVQAMFSELGYELRDALAFKEGKAS